MVAIFGYLLSWFINFVLLSIIVAIYDESRGYGIERIPWLPFTISFIVPAILEVIAFLLEGKPFLAIVFPLVDYLI